MRFTNVLNAQHLGWTFKKHWQLQGKRVPRDTGARSELEKLGIQVKDPNELLSTKIEPKRIDIVGFQPTAVAAQDHTHPNWHDQLCRVYGNSNVLLEGLAQAQILTKTIEINSFPKNIEESIAKMQLPITVDRNIKNSIMEALVFDAEQVKLPKVKIPERPAFNLPRLYGISHERRNKLLISKLLFECEKLAGLKVTSNRNIVSNADFKVTLRRCEDILQFDVNADKMITATKPIEPMRSTLDADLPDLYPIKCTVTIPKKNIYTTNNIYCLSKTISCSHPHTIFLHFDKETVGNLHETSVTTSQFHSRTMLKAFAVAASRAKQLYGDLAVENLPKPIVVQSIQTDGRVFHFGILQLNTLALSDTEGVKNYWFHQQNMDLFTECGYKVGRPTLEGYNKDVFRVLHAFYNNA